MLTQIVQVLTVYISLQHLKISEERLQLERDRIPVTPINQEGTTHE